MKPRVFSRSALGGAVSLLVGVGVGSAVLACNGGPSAPPDNPGDVKTTANGTPAWATPPDAGPPGPAEPRHDDKLVPRATFFGNPVFTSPRVSPDGKWIAYRAPVVGVLNVMVTPSKTPIDLNDDAKALTHEKNRPVAGLAWSYTPGVLLYIQDATGDENDHILAVSTDIDSSEARDLTPYQGARSELVGLSPKHPHEAMIAINDRDPKWPDLYRVDILTGKRTLVQKNDKELADFHTDDDFQLRLASHAEKDGSTKILAPGKAKAFDDVILTIPFDDGWVTHLEDIDSSGRSVSFVDSRNRDTAALFALDLAAPHKATLLAEDAKADVSLRLADPKTHKPLLAGSEYQRRTDIVIDKSLQKDLDFLKRVVPDADLEWGNCSSDFSLCTVAFHLSDAPTKWYLYNRTTKTVDLLASERPDLDKVKLAKMLPELIQARDGLPLVSYLTLPVGSDADGNGVPDKPLPLVLRPHGGPWSRDSWGLDTRAQWLANRGYAVLAVNFRGSEGFGKKFLNAGNREWGAKMQDDLTDAVNWAIASKIADPAKVAIYGGSYGGYAVLAGLTTTPGLYACGVDYFGVANLITIQEAIPPYWEAMRTQLAKRIGDPTTDEGKKFLLSRSPTSHVAAIKKPLLIGQGMNDVRVKPAESKQIVDEMKAKGLPVTYLTFSDEGHGFYRPENNEAASAVAETFLAQCLGGPAEPVGRSFDGSTLAVPEGAKQIFGLPDALAAHAEAVKESAQQAR